MSSRDKTNSTSGTKRLSRIIILLAPFLIILLLEITLRITNYGGSLALFVAGQDKELSDFLMCNQNLGQRYFFNQNTKPAPPKDLFLKTKPEHGYRIFVLGGSTASGYPYGNNMMFPRILNFRLSHIFPEKHIEVINTAMIAVNSYTLQDLIDEIFAQQPDAILIYAGHDEFYGALGVASRESFGTNRAVVHLFLKLQRFKTFILARNFVAAVRNGFDKIAKDKPTVDPSETLMARIVAEQSIPYKCSLYDAGLAQFQDNLERILKKAQQHNVPVVLSELVSNIKDQPPFLSVRSDSSQTAEHAFFEGKKHEQLGEYPEARKALSHAKDLDALRFRASEDVNDIIHAKAQQYKTPVVPMKAWFEAKSEHGIIGGDLMIDHLHPTMSGYFIMADAFLNTMKENNLIDSQWDESRVQSSINMEKEWGRTALDSAAANLNTFYLKGGWPFQPQHGPNESLKNFHPITQIETLALRILTDPNFSLIAGHFELAQHYESRGNYEKAAEEYKAAYYTIPYEIEFYEGAVSNLLKLNKTEKALETLLLANQYGHSNFTDKWTGQLLAEADRYTEALPYLERTYNESPQNTQVMQLYITALHGTGNSERANELAKQLTEQIKADSAKFNPQSEDDRKELTHTMLLKGAADNLEKKNYRRALSLFRKAHSLKESAYTAKWIGILDLKFGQLEEAANLLQQAADMSPDDFEARYNLCNAYILLKQRGNAERVLRELEALRPDFDDPQHLRERIENM